MEEIAAAHPSAGAAAGDEAGGASSCTSPTPTPTPTPEPSFSTWLDNDDDEGDVSRICRNPSVKFARQDCLLQRLSHSSARQCEVCRHPFSLAPVYAENAPVRLAFQKFVVGMAMEACHAIQFFVRLAFVLSAWLLIIPFFTFWIWRWTFVKSLGEAQSLFLSHISGPLFFTDCLHGFLLSASIVFIFLGATSLRDYYRHLREPGRHDALRDDEGHERHGAGAIRRLRGPTNRIRAGDDGNAKDGGATQGIVGAGQIIRRNAENIAARLEMQAAHLEAHVKQMFDGLDDADGAEDVPFDELVGMQGPLFHLVENALTVLAGNVIFLDAVIFIPFSLGRITLYSLSWLLSSASGPLLSTVVPLTTSALFLANITVKSALTSFKSILSEGQSKGIHQQGVEVAAAFSKLNATGIEEISSSAGRNVSGDLSKVVLAGFSQLSDVTTLAVGYMLIFGMVVFYLGLTALIRYNRGKRLTIGKPQK